MNNLLAGIEKVLSIIRSNAWWEYKFPPILAIGYMVIVNSGYPFAQIWPALILLLLSLITGAAYVSVLNDATDVTDDAAAAKVNRMANFSIVKRILLVVIALIAGVGFSIFYASHRPAMLLYISCYISFTLYSLPPFRLKKKGIAGAIADAAGSQLFPTLFFAEYLAFKTGYSIGYYQLIFIGVWSACFGLRGILWHQFHDMEKDILSRTKTIVQSLNNKQVVWCGTLIMSVELLTFVLILFTFKLLLPALLLVFYFIYSFLLNKKWRIMFIIIRPAYSTYRIFMNEYYQVFLPLSILTSAAFSQPFALIILVFHIALFPVNTTRIFKELGMLLTRIDILMRKLSVKL